MNCYLCESTSFNTRKGQVRDAPDLKILECTHCGLVTLSSLGHIQSGFYEESGMHGAEPTPMETWLKDTDWDDQRRFDMLKPMLPNKKLLDFGCGAAGFLNKAQHLADMFTALRNIEVALGDGIKRITLSEARNKPVARKSLVASQAIKVGEVFSAQNITTKRPGTGISPMRWDEVIGQVAQKNYKEGDLI